MNTIEVVAYNRSDLSTSTTKQLRNEGMVPGVLYGAEDHVHFYAPAYLLNKLVNTPDVFFVQLNVEGKEYRCILQEVQYHPVSDNLLHVDFRELTAGRKVKMDIPVSLEGTAPGVTAGGVLVRKRRKVTVKALPKNMPGEIKLDISELGLGKSLKVRDLKVENGEILVPERITVCSVEIPRGLKAAAAAEDGDGDEGAEEAAAEGADAPAPEESSEA